MVATAGALESLSPLEGYRVAVTADRRASELAELLRRKGAEVVLAPVIRTLPLGQENALRRVTLEVVKRPPDLVIATTGIGLRGWFAAAQAWGLGDELRIALRRARLVARGPKVSAAATQVDLEVWRQEPTEQLRYLIEGLERDGELSGARVLLQLPGEELPEMVAKLTSAGATVVAAPVYELRLPDDPAPIQRVIAAVAEGRLDAVTFTSAPAVRNLDRMAGEMRMGDRVRRSFESRVVAACVGPVTAAQFRFLGLGAPVWPERGRLGLLVKVLSERLVESRRRLQLGAAEVVIQGSVVISSDHRVDLTARERAVLSMLTRHPGAVVPKSVLLREGWGAPATDQHVLEVTVARLRRRLRPAGLAVVAIPRRGYRLATLPA